VLVGFGGAGALSYAVATHADIAPATTTSTTTPGGAKGWRGEGIGKGPGMMGVMYGRGVMGTITAINGSMITVTSTHSTRSEKTTAKTVSGTTGTSTSNTPTMTTTTYTVDATNAKILKLNGGIVTPGTKPVAPTTITLAQLAIGDMIMAQGKLSGTTLTATQIVTGTFPKFTPPAKPVAVGKVTAVNGNTIALTEMMSKNSSTTTYTVDATNAVITKITPPVKPTTTVTTGTPAKFVRPASTTITVAGIQVGDMLMVEGSVNGMSVTATSIVDGTMFRWFHGGHGFQPIH
jgi:hypothetical protein